MVKILLVNDSGHKYKDAILKAFPKDDVKLISLTEGNVNVFNVDRLREQIKVVICDNVFIDDVSYIVLCGAIILNVLTCNIVKQLGGKVNVLIYDPRDSTYIKREDVI